MVTSANIRSRLLSAEMSPYPTDMRVAIVQYKLARYYRRAKNHPETVPRAVRRTNDEEAGQPQYSINKTSRKLWWLGLGVRVRVEAIVPRTAAMFVSGTVQ